MSSILAGVVATIVTLPLLCYLFVFIIMKQITKHHRRAVRMAVDTTTFFLIISVHYLIITIWDRNYLWIILLTMLLSAGVFSIMHWKVKQEINFKLVFKGFWRFNFLLFVTVYLILVAIGLFKNVSYLITMP